MQVAEAFAGFTPGEADGLRRAMSRKRSHEMLQGHRERFIEGALRHAGAPTASQAAERVWEMVEGFAGFGFPKAHSAAFGLLAYQSTWLRVHYGAEFLCALLNEQPMGFYAPDSLVHEAENRGIAMLGLDVNASQVQCAVEHGGVRLGLGYIKGVRERRRCTRWWRERERNGPFASLGDLAGARRLQARRRSSSWRGRAPATASLSGPAGALPGPASATGARRCGSWGWRRRPRRSGERVPATARSVGESTQLALPLELPAPPRLRALGRWQRLIADYSTSGVTIGEHALAILRGRLTVPMLATSAQLPRLPSGCQVAVAGLVIARQRPGTAKGTMFLLFEDEFGTVNLIVPKAVYERHRQLARAEPLLLARGSSGARAGGGQRDRARAGAARALPARRPRGGGGQGRTGARAPAAGARARVRSATSAGRLGAASRGAAARRQSGRGGGGGASMRAAAPPMQSFAMGRRR